MKQIKISEMNKADLIEQFKTYLDKLKTTEGEVHFSKKLELAEQAQTKAELYISAVAYLKMLLYVRDTSTEIAWHGVVRRFTDKNAYLIKDVFLYPQTLSGATVTTDQEEYNKWTEELDDDTINTMRFQGHSHVNFAVTPSGVDMNFYNDILQTLQKNDYYIFMILNKTGDTTFLIYDLEKNLIYENADINVHIIENNTNTSLIQSIKADKNKYCKIPTSNFNYGKGTFSYNYYYDDEYFDYYKDYNNKDFLGNSKSNPTETTLKIKPKYKNTTLKGKLK